MDINKSRNHASHFYFHAEEFMLGDPDYIENLFSYETVQLNLSGSTDYDPTLLWLTFRAVDGYLARLLATFVDDERIHASSEQMVLSAAHQVATR